MKIRMVTLICLLGVLSACSNLLFYPDKNQYHTPDELQLVSKDVYIKTPDGETLFAWWLPASTHKTKGSVLFLHGNAENISTHFSNIAWLPGAGYNVLALDYRGYGFSTGSPDLEGVLVDIEAGLQALVTHYNEEQLPVIVLGQSIGASLSMTFVGSSVLAQQHVRALIVDSGFESFQGIVQEKLSAFWFTWPFQYPLSWLIPSSYDPLYYVDELATIPTLFFHSINDQVIPYHHGLTLFNKSRSEKELVTAGGFHIQTFINKDNQQKLLDFLNQHTSKLDVAPKVLVEN